jgi:CubicO group peptidase (beta-lactamase class C family)
MKKSFFLSIGFLAFLTCTYGQTKQDKQLEKILDNLLSPQFKIAEPGCEILVAKKGEIVYKKAFGNANMELNMSIRPDMVFNLASVTKQFTAIAILQLVEQGKISLTDSLQKYIPDYPSKSYTITVENLLTHTSGIRDYMQIDYANVYMERWDFKPKQLIDSFKNYALEFEPGTKFSYSNSGYYLLGYIIQIVSGQSYQSYIQDHLLKPIGLAHTYFDSSSIIIPNRVNGYRKEEDVFKNVDYWSPTIEYAAGGLISNVDDLFKWHKGLYSYQILKKETLQKAFVPYQLKDGTETGYGYGWFIKTSNGIKSIEHEGGIPGFKSNVIYFPAEDIFIATLYNCGTVPIDELTNTISSMSLGKPLQTDVKIDTKLLDEYVGVYQLTIDTSRTIIMRKEKNQLIAEVSKTEKIQILFQSETEFQFKNLLDANCVFIKENSKVTKFNVSQNGQFTWVKIQ